MFTKDLSTWYSAALVRQGAVCLPVREQLRTDSKIHRLTTYSYYSNTTLVPSFNIFWVEMYQI